MLRNVYAAPVQAEESRIRLAKHLAKCFHGDFEAPMWVWLLSLRSLSLDAYNMENFQKVAKELEGWGKLSFFPVSRV